MMDVLFEFNQKRFFPFHEESEEAILQKTYLDRWMVYAVVIIILFGCNLVPETANIFYLSRRDPLLPCRK